MYAVNTLLGTSDSMFVFFCDYAGVSKHRDGTVHWSLHLYVIHCVMDF